MKKNTIVNLLCTVFAAMVLLSSCSIEYRNSHRRHYDNHDNNRNESERHDSYHR
ncbi:MAG TPA: hypothetical protein VK543_07995 [Puia sp.]|nr:hypothetical protein [Puia sp.]